MTAAPTRSRYFWPLLVLVLLAGFGLRVWHLGEASLWVDEAWTDVWAKPPLLETLQKTTLKSGAIEMPLYLGILHGFPTENEFLLRFPSALLGTASIAALAGLARRIYRSDPLALAAAALLALNPYHVLLSRTARPYALLSLTTIMACAYFLMLLRGHRTRTTWIAFVAWSMASYLTHYYALFLPLAQYVVFAFVLGGQRRFFRQWLGAQAVAGLPVPLLLLAQLLRDEQLEMGIGWIPDARPVDLVLTLWNMSTGYTGSTAWYLLPAVIVVSVGLVSGTVYALREYRANPANLCWVWLVVLPLALGLIVSRLLTPLYVDRYFLEIQAGVVLLMVYGLARLPGRARWRGALAALVILSGGGHTLVMLGSGDYQREDWRGAMAALKTGYQPGDGLLVEPPFALHSFRRYFGSSEWVEDSLWTTGPDADNPSADRVWAVYRNPIENIHRQGLMPAFDPFQPGATPLADWLIARRDRILSRQDFNGVTVFLVDMRGEPPPGAE